MKTRYNHASLDYRRILMPQQQYQAALNKGMPPQQAMKAAYPSGGPSGPGMAGKASAAGIPRPGAPQAMRPSGTPGQGGGQAEAQLMSMVNRIAQVAKQLGPDVVQKVKAALDSALGGGAPGGSAMAAGGPSRRIPTPPQMGGGAPGGGMPGRKPPGMI